MIYTEFGVYDENGVLIKIVNSDNVIVADMTKTELENHSCGAISSYRGGLSIDEINTRNKELIAALTVRCYFVAQVKGSYIPNFQIDNDKRAGEESWFVANYNVVGDDGGTLEKDLIKLGEGYDQDSILSIRNGKGYLIGTSKRDGAFPDYGQCLEADKCNLGKAYGEFFSRIKNKKINLEAKIPDTIDEKLEMSELGEAVWKRL